MASDPASLIGTTLGDYTLQGILSHSRAGVLYKAYHRALQRDAACRVLGATAREAPEQVARALFVARAISRLRHPNLIDIYDCDELPDGRPYLLMDLLTGTRLSVSMQSGPLDIRFVSTVAEQICSGLGAAHAARVPHLFLTPRSIFVSKLADGQLEATLTDFGEWGTVDGELRRYLSPEQLAGKPGDARSDIYALGCILYELFTGTPYSPAAPENPPSGVRKSQQLATLPAHGLLPGVDPRIDGVLRRALAAAPGARYSSVEALWRELSPLLPAQGTLSPPPIIKPADAARRSQPGIPTLPGRARTPARGRLVRYALVGAAGLVGLSVASYLFLRPQKPPPAVAVAPIDPLTLHAQAEQVLLEALRAQDAALRRSSLRALSQSHDPRYAAWIEPLLDDADAAVQAEAARALGKLGAPGTIASLRAHVHAAAELRLACAEALHLLGDATGSKLLRQLLARPPSAEAELRAALALVGSREGEQALQRRIKNAPPDSDETAQILSQRALRGDLSAQKELERRLTEAGPPSTQRLEIAGALLRLGSPAAQKLLSRIAGAPGPLQALAAKLLCDADDPTAQALLREAVADAARPIGARALAASGLGVCGDRTDAALLARLLSQAGPRAELRLPLAEALLRLTGSDPSLLAQSGLAWSEQALSDERFSVRESAALLLGDVDLSILGRLLRRSPLAATAPLRPGAALGLLARAAADEDVRVRMAALRAIGRQGSQLSASAATPATGTTTGTTPVPVNERIDLEPLRTAARARTSGRIEDERERLRAAVALEQLGDGSATSMLQEALRSEKPQLRRTALEEIPASSRVASSEVVRLLGDGDTGVRFAAARLLALRKDRSAIAVLRETMTQGGSDGLRARALLLELGESMPVDQGTLRSVDLDEAMRSADPLTRLAAVEAALALPGQKALVLLDKAARDRDSVLRFRVSEAAALLLKGASRAAAQKLLQRLLSDEDAAVRASAGLLLAHDFETLGKARGEAPVARRPPALPPASLGASEALPADDELNEAEKRLAAQIKTLLAQSAAALAKRDLAAAESALLKAGALCRRQASSKGVCGRSLPRIVFQLATVHEQQEKWSLSQSEYQRVEDQASGELKSQAKSAITRLSKRLGQLVVYKPVGKKCSRVELWMPAGTHKFSANGQTKSVQLSAGQRVEVRLCDGK